MSFLATARNTFLLALLLFGTSAAAFAQGSLHLSKNSDFSTDDAVFEYGDSLFILVEAPDVDYTDLDLNELRIKSSNGFEYDAAMTNNLDGTYTASLLLEGQANAIALEEIFYVEVRLEDSKGNGFREDARFAIGVSHTPVDVEIRGVIDEVGDSFIVILDRKIFVTDDTRILDEDENEIPFSDLRQGDIVRVRFSISFSGELIAHRIDLRNDQGIEVRVVGEISDIGDSFVVVLGRTFEVDSTTAVKDKNGAPIRFSELAVGELVEIEAHVFPNDRIVADCIQRKDRPAGIVEFRGVIEDFFDRGIVVFGRRVGVTANTRILSDEGDVLEYADLEIGQVVKVTAVVTLDGSLVATKIVVLRDGGIVVRGEITEIGDRFIAVGNAKFIVTEDTEIETEDGHDIEFERLKVGLSVIVEAGLNANGMFVASEITVVRPSLSYLTLTGRVSAIGDRAFSLNGHRMRVTKYTEFFDENGEEVSFSDLTVGQRVRVLAVAFIGHTDEAPTFFAVRVKFLEDRQKRIVGFIKEVTPTSITVGDVAASITDETEVFGQNGDPIAVSDLEAGMLVALWIREGDDGTLIATRIRVLPRIEDEIGVAGVVESLGDSSLVVLGQTFELLSTSVVRDVNGNIIDLSGLEVGKSVALRGEMLAGGTLVALHVQALPNGVNDIKVLGPVESTGINTIEVLGIHFFVDSDTKIFDLARNEVSLDQLAVGQTVLLQAVGLPDGTRLAKRIQVQDVVVSSGSIVLADGMINVLGVDYALQSDALVIGENGELLDISVLKDNMFCEIRAAVAEDGTVEVSKVKIFESAGSIGVEDPLGQLPRLITLRENYPNPFNPSTTIQFELDGSLDGQMTTLSVYDITGRHVKTLVSTPLNAGLHTFAWDATDATGNAVASGMYFYRVQSGSYIDTKSMTLLK